MIDELQKLLTEKQLADLVLGLKAARAQGDGWVRIEYRDGKPRWVEVARRFVFDPGERK